MTTQPADPMAEANAFLQGGAPTAKFPTLGTTIEGTVISAEVTQQTDLDNTPLVWDDGKPRMQVVATLQTSLFDPEIEGDDGSRRLFIKGQMQAAVRQAIAASGEHGLARGGTLKVQYHADGEAPRKGFNAQKLYRAKYTPPAEINEGDWPNDDTGLDEGLPF